MSSSVVAYLVGAGTTLAAQTVLQLYVVPSVEARKRREARFEENVKELGDLLSGAVTDAAWTATSSMTVNAATITTAAAHRDELTEGQVEVHRRFVMEGRDDEAAYVALIQGRVRLLTDRIVDHSPDAPELRGFRETARRLVSSPPTSALIASFDALTVKISAEQAHESWTAERDQLTALINETAKLSARKRPPRISHSRALGLKIKRSEPVAKVGRWRASRAVAREGATQ